MKYTTLRIFALLSAAFSLTASAQRTSESFNLDWRFSLGYASDMQRDFGHGTEYFTYMCKVGSNGENNGPINPKFDDSKWRKVTLPYDWVVDLPYSREASHSHGYKTVGWKYPSMSVGWYRKRFSVPESDLGRHISVEFDGIYRDAQVFCNGYFLGQERSGYASTAYDLTDYLNYGGDNLITVRADASLEEGWYYEGAGIYRDVRLVKTNRIFVSYCGTNVETRLLNGNKSAELTVSTTVMNGGMETKTVARVIQKLIDGEGKVVAVSDRADVDENRRCKPKSMFIDRQVMEVSSPILWRVDNPYLYTLVTDVMCSDGIVDEYKTQVGIRTIAFDKEKGFLLNGEKVEMKGVNLHLDHAGVGTGIPDSLWAYRIRRLKSFGCNAIRCSHNPASPVMLDLCDRMGMLVIDENRQMGTNADQLNLFYRMIQRDRNHPSVILWSIGNEEWALEGTETGRRIASSLSEYVHCIDSTRPTTVGNAGGNVLIKGVDIKGYNYIAQNDIDGQRRENPSLIGVGTEETSGCGTRNEYFTDSVKGYMQPLNRSLMNGQIDIIERGWKFYQARPWLGGLFYWTGFDYRGEPNPLVYPATGSQFGILDYCGFPKDEAFYLQSVWTDKPVLHLSPHWNLKGHEGDSVSVWAYSNVDEIELFVNDRSVGRKTMPKNGHLEWKTVYQPGKLFAQGYIHGKKSVAALVGITSEAVTVKIVSSKTYINADGEDVVVIDMALYDKQGRAVPDACNSLNVSIDGPAEIIGYGNGNPGFKEVERPTGDKRSFDIKAFNGLAQVIVRSVNGKSGDVLISVSGMNLKTVKTKLFSNAI